MTDRYTPSCPADLSWHVPAARQGQAVEIAYATDHEGDLIWRRTTDRSCAPWREEYEWAPLDLAGYEDGVWQDEPDVPEDAWERGDALSAEEDR